MAERRGKRWTAEEDESLVTCWKEVSAEELAAMLPGRTWLSIYQRALEKRLRGRTKRELVLHAAKRAGYTITAFRGLLARHGVNLWRGYKSRSAESSNVLYVEPGDVDRAVKAELSAETLNLASQRLHIVPGILAEFLKVRGYTPAPRDRFPMSLLDDVAREYQACRYERMKKRAHAAAKARLQRRQERQRAA